jgi:hypothetical protein
MGLSKEEKQARNRAIKGIRTFTSKEKEEYVFISYKSDNWSFVLDKLVRSLVNTCGLRVYFDINFEDDNSPWVDNMHDAITYNRCKAVLACVSKEYMTSYACAMELMQALSYETQLMRHGEKDLQIIPIIVDDSESVVAAGKDAPMSPIAIREWDFYQKILKEAMEGTAGKPQLSEVHKTLQLLNDRQAKASLALLSAFIMAALADGHERDPKVSSSLDEFIGHLSKTLHNISDQLFDEALIGTCPPEESAPPEQVKPQAPVVSQPVQPISAAPTAPVAPSVPAPAPVPTVPSAPVVTASPGAAITPQTTIGEFRDYMADESNNAQLLKLWDSMKKGPGYVVLAAILSGPGIGGAARKNFIINIAKTTANGAPNSSTWSSMVAGYMNDSRSLGSVANVYKSLPTSMTLGEVENKFRAADEPGFQPLRGSTDELLENFALLYHTGAKISKQKM